MEYRTLVIGKDLVWYSWDNVHYRPTFDRNAGVFWSGEKEYRLIRILYGL